LLEAPVPNQGIRRIVWIDFIELPINVVVAIDFVYRVVGASRYPGLRETRPTESHFFAWF